MELKDIDLWPVWDAIRCQTLILARGVFDVLDPADAIAMTERGPRAQLIELPGMGHAPALMADDQIAIVRDWLSPSAMLLRIASIIFPVLAVAGIGWLYARWKQPDLTDLNQINMDVFTPALVFWALTNKPFTAQEFLDLSIGGVVVILGSGLLLLPVVPC